MNIKSPNIIFIVADDLGYADLSCCGQTDFQTPNLDALASSGSRFTQSYANAPLCTNTRVALMTGRYQYRFTLGLTEPLRYKNKDDPKMGLPADHPTLPLRLKDAGYSTALIGKWHLGALPLFSPLRSGYQSFFGIMGGYTGYYTQQGDGGEHDFYESETKIEVQGYVTHLLTAKTIEHIHSRNSSDQPFFISLHYTAPHWPWSAPSVESAARERESDFKLHADGGSPRIYAEMVQEMDKGIGQVIQALKETGKLNNTLIIFTSDNGGERYSKNWPFVGRKRDLLEGGLRVPQILSWPAKIAPNKVCQQVCISMDLTATCLEAAGITVDSTYPIDGESLLPILIDKRSEKSRTLFWRMKEREQRSVRDGDWKYLKVKEQEFLFDLSYDWRERTNFASKHPEILSDLKRKWENWNKDMLPMPDHPTPINVNLSDMMW